MTDVPPTVKKTRKGALPPPPIAALSTALDCPKISVDWLAGDGSDRCYYRIHAQSTGSDRETTYVLMQLSGQDAEALENGRYEWIEMADVLSSHKVLVPRVIRALPEYAALIIEDYGDVMLESLFHPEKAMPTEAIEDAYGAAVEMAVNFLTIPEESSQTWCKRSFDQERFEWELAFFQKKYVKPILRMGFDDEVQELFVEEGRRLAAFLSSYSHYFTHRDFHSRNLMIEEAGLAVIDFQDARLGPPAYDLVSLLFDSYVPLSHDKRLELLRAAIERVRSTAGDKLADLITDTWKPTLLQRQLKALGSFGFLTIDKNRGSYLQYCPHAIQMLLDSELEDERWPFLSGEFLRQLNRTIHGDFEA